MSVEFSIVIPLYNKCDSIVRAIESVLSQTIGDFEIIVIDDGSTDNSSKQVEALNHPLVKLIRQDNAGVAAARNHGISVARGQYVAFLDADDRYHPHFLKEIKALIVNYPGAGMYCTAYEFVYSENHLQPAKINVLPGLQRQLIDDYFRVCAAGDLLVSSSSVVIPKLVLDEIQGFPVNENMGEDQSVWSQIALKYPTAYSVRILSQYYQDASNRLMNTVDACTELPFSVRLQNALDSNKVDDHLRASVEDYVSAHLIDLVRRNFISNRLDVCRSLLLDVRSRRQIRRWSYWFMRVQATIFCNNFRSV